MGRLPVTRTVITYDLTLTFCRTLAILVKNGVDISTSLRLIRGVVRLPAAGAEIDKVIADVRQGRRLSESLSRRTLLPGHVVQMIRVGEESGNLADSTDRIAGFYEAKLDSALGRVTAIIGPAMMIGVSLLVAMADHFGHDGPHQHQRPARIGDIHGSCRASNPFSRLPSPPRPDGGFTLVELLVVLVILSLVMGLVGPRVLNYLGSSRERAAKLQIESFASALDLFYLDNGRFPTSSEGLGALVKRPAAADKWGGPYLQQDGVPTDPWGNAYEYKVPRARAPYVITLLRRGRQEGRNR